MLPGEIILSHDFDSAPGAHEAFVEYFNDLSEPVIELGGGPRNDRQVDCSAA